MVVKSDKDDKDEMHEDELAAAFALRAEGFKPLFSLPGGGPNDDGGGAFRWLTTA
jgi:hypothetical protein